MRRRASRLDGAIASGHASNMATKVDHVLQEALALPADDRAKVAAKLLASLPNKPSPTPRRLIDLAGRGAGVWGADSTAALQHQRDEWR